MPLNIWVNRSNLPRVLHIPFWFLASFSLLTASRCHMHRLVHSLINNTPSSSFWSRFLQSILWRKACWLQLFFTCSNVRKIKVKSSRIEVMSYSTLKKMNLVENKTTLHGTTECIFPSTFFYTPEWKIQHIKILKRMYYFEVNMSEYRGYLPRC